jgi:hypothetical protein
MTVKRRKNTNIKSFSIKAKIIKDLSKNASKDRKAPQIILLRIERQQQNSLRATCLTP